jgi:hypothetical protein
MTMLIPSAIIFAVLAVFLHISTSTDSTWVHAGKEVRACQQAAAKLAVNLPPAEKAIVLGIPKTHMAAHMIYNGDTFKTMLRPPFARQNLSSSFITFDPILFGPSQYINASRFKETLQSPKLSGVYVWNRTDRSLDPVPLTQTPPSETDLPLSLDVGASQTQVYSAGHAVVSRSDSGGIKFISVVPGDGLRFSGLNINPLSIDFLELKVRMVKPPRAGELVFKTQWLGDHSGIATGSIAENEAVAEVQSDQLSSNSTTIRIPLSHYWRWYTEGNIKELRLFLPNEGSGTSTEITSACLRSAVHLRPGLHVLGARDNGVGVYEAKQTDGLSYDVSHIPGACGVVVESSAPNFFFDLIDGNSTREKGSPNNLYFSHKATGVNGEVKLGTNVCPVGGYTQVRVQALNAAGQAIGEYSDPVTLLIH